MKICYAIVSILYTVTISDCLTDAEVSSRHQFKLCGLYSGSH